MEIENEKKSFFRDDDEIDKHTLSVLIIFSFSGVRSSSVSNDKFVSLKGNMNASKGASEQFGDLPSLYSVKTRSNSLEASKVSQLRSRL